MCNKVITQFYLPPTHKPYLPLRPSSKVSPPFGWYLLHLLTKGWPGWVDLGRWLHTEINALYRELNSDMVTDPSTNQTRRRLTSLIETSALPLRPTITCVYRCNVTCNLASVIFGWLLYFQPFVADVCLPITRSDSLIDCLFAQLSSMAHCSNAEQTSW